MASRRRTAEKFTNIAKPARYKLTAKRTTPPTRPPAGRDFCAELLTVSDEFTRNGNYRKVDIELLSGVKPGIQLADFYVGTVREFTMDESAVMPYDLVREQIITREIYLLAPVESER